MDLPRSTTLVRPLVPGMMALSLMGIYLVTMAPGITWANQGSDGGDLITAAATGGVAHPTGYPVYLLLARGFQILPIGSLAYRTNLMSALAAVCACLVIFHLVKRAQPSSIGWRNTLAGLVSAFALGLSPLFWSQAVITEVHALHCLFIAGLLFLHDRDLTPSLASKQRDCLLGLTFGLALGNHATTLLLLPVLFTPNQRLVSSLRHRFAWLAVGLLPYLTLPLRALSRPPVNWGNPISPGGFAWLVSGELYQDQLAGWSPAVWGPLQAAASLFLEQFGILGLIIGLMGLVVYNRPGCLKGISIWMLCAFSTFAIFYGSEDSFLYLIPACLCFSIWIGMGLRGVMNAAASKFPGAGIAIGLLVAANLLVHAGRHWTMVDASDDLRAEQFGRAVLAQAPSQAILFAKGDRAVFTMWYFHHALGERPDLVLIATDLLPHEWYQEALRNTYPDLILPAYAPFPGVVIGSNPDREICYLNQDLAAPISCRQ